MISAILEIVACVIAALFGFIGVFIGFQHQNVYMVAVSGLLCALVVIYLSMLAEIIQGKQSKRMVLICEVLNKTIYVTILIQVISLSSLV